MAAIVDDGAIKILTLDGGGIQGLSTLTILSDVCNAIAAKKETSVKPAPHQLFDVIAGIGTGGWLALLLGRYRLDIVKATSVYMEIVEALDPKTTAQRAVSKYRTHARLDQRKLIAKIDEILHKYHLDEYLLDKAHPDVTAKNCDTRCRYTFTAAVIESSKTEEPLRYQLFRTYMPRDKTSEFYCAGPDPATCRISAACAATGAAKGVLQPYQFGATFFDSRFPDPHPLSRLALNETFHMFGGKPSLSVILSIGPGIPTDNDLNEYKKLSRKFSWPARSSLQSFRRKPGVETPTAQPHKQHPEQGARRTMTVDSWSSTSSSSDEEKRLQQTIRDTLVNEYGDANIYCRLGPLRSCDKLSLNDVTAVNLSNEEIKLYLDMENTKKSIGEAASRYLTSTVAVVESVV